MNYQPVIVEKQWRITANGEVMPDVYANSVEVIAALQALRNGHTATTVATISRKQAAKREYRESVGK